MIDAIVDDGTDRARERARGTDDHARTGTRLGNLRGGKTELDKDRTVVRFTATRPAVITIRSWVV